MTDNEIIKALECCIGDTEGKNCFDCHLYEIDDCQAQMCLDALDLINRQKAEIEKLKAEKNILLNTTVSAYLAEEQVRVAKAEAYKEFAERLKEMFRNDGLYLFYANQIDNLLKELVGD